MPSFALSSAEALQGSNRLVGVCPNGGVLCACTQVSRIADRRIDGQVRLGHRPLDLAPLQAAILQPAMVT